MKKTCFLTCFIFYFSCSFSQQENNQWILPGYLPNVHSLIDFNNGSPDTTTVLSYIRFFLTNASICDTNGQLLFYTNGNIIFNRNHDTLQNGTGINPGSLTNYYLPNGMGVPQGAFIIPRPGYYGQYLAFYVSGEPCPLASQPVNFPYSIIDMSLDGGLGGIIPGQKDIHAYDDTLIYGRITGTKHANGRDWWIITHKSDTDIYDILLVTPDTMIMHQQQIGRKHVFEQFVMQAAFSPQGDKYVIGLTEFLNDSLPNGVDLLDFDRCTGTFSNERNIIVPDGEYTSTGCSFSPNGRWLYVNTAKYIYQYDTWSGNINSTVTQVAQWDTTIFPYNNYFFQLLAPDGKIYITNQMSADYLHVIDQPDVQGIGCNVIQRGLHVPVVNTFVMPNAANYSLGEISGSICDSLTGIKENEFSDLKFQVFPNPVLQNGLITFNYVLPQNKEGTIEIFDITGKKVYASHLSQWSTVHKVKAKFSSGVYAVKISSEKRSEYLKFIVQ